jgi:hypothetical protein
MGKGMARRIAFTATIVVVTSLLPGPALAGHPNSVHFAATCANPASTDCVVSAKYGTANGAGGTNLSTLGGVALAVYKDTALGYVQVEIRDSPGTGGLEDYDVSQALPTNTEITIVIRFANAFTPAALIAVAYLPNWTWDAGAREMTIIAFPRESSWSTNPLNCNDVTATNDHAAMFLMAIDDTTVENADPAAQAEIAAFLEKFKGGYISTNAQCFALPFYDPFDNAVKFILGAPHFKNNGFLNTGFFRVLVPDPVITDLWGLVPAALAPAAVNITVGGNAAAFTMVRATGRAPFPDGWIFENVLPVGFSTPTVAIAPASASSVVPDAPVAIPADPSGKAVDSTRAVQLPQTGVFAVPVTVSRGASLAFDQGTAATVGGAPFRGVVHPPFPIAVDPTGRGLVSIVQVGVNGVGPGADVLLDKPATLTLVPPASASALATSSTAAAYQPVDLDAPGGPQYLPGRVTDKGIAVDIKRLRQGPNRFGLAKIPRPAVKAVAPAFEKLSGFHSRYAGQSASLELAPGQLVDVEVRLANAGTEPWVRGETGREARLGSAGPLDNTRDFDLGVLVAPVAGQSRFATTAESVVAPGAVGTFPMRLRAPLTAGTHRVNLRPVIDGATWMEDQGIYVELTVK